MKNGFKQLILGWLLITVVSAMAGAAVVDVWVKDAATGMPVKDAVLVVMNGADTAAVASSKATEASRFLLDVSATAVEEREAADAAPKTFSVVATYPNPCDDRVTLAVADPAGGALRMEIFNVLGRRIYAGQVGIDPGAGAALDLRLKSFASGLYFVLLTDGFGNTHAGKFLKMGRAFSSAYPEVALDGIRPLQPARKKGAVRSSTAGTEYVFTAFTSKNSKNAAGGHVGGIATAAVTVRGDTAVDLMLEKAPFSRNGQNMAPRASSPITVDGKEDESAWSSAEWGPINQLWLGDDPSPEDFTGRYKIAWTPERMYFLIEIRDDALSDQFPDPSSNYYMDDCLELFIDENASGGNHQNNYNAFAYHIALDYHIADLGLNGRVKDFTDHAEVSRTDEGGLSTWEIGLKVFPDTFNENIETNVPVTLTAGKLLGFMAAYCDNDGSYNRESFIGSVFIPGPDKNQGWIDAGVFGTLELLP